MTRSEQMRRCVVSAVVSVSCLFSVLPAYGQEKADGRQVFDLQGCVQMAVAESPEIGEGRYEEEVYRAKKMQADSSAYPTIEVLALAGPSPEARKEDFLKTNVKSGTINGIFGSAGISLIQPLYTFGKIGSYKKAAYKGLRVAEAGTQKKTSEIILRTNELYFSLLMAKDMRNLVLEVRDELVKAIGTAEKQLSNNTAGADEVNLFKLRAFIGEADRNLNEADKGISVARDGLMTSMGLQRGADFEIADATLSPLERKPGDLAEYSRLAIAMRPELNQIREGLDARDALIQAEKAAAYPDIFVGLMGSIAGATNRDRVYNPYVFDSFSHTSGAAFVGLKWSLDFGVTRGKVKEAEAEYNKLLEKKRFADDAIPFQVRKAYLDFQEADKNIGRMDDAHKNARKWLVAASSSFDMGVGDAKDVADAALTYAQMKVNYIRSLYNQRMAYANLLYAAGLDMKDLQ
ncbi:MAG: TolC family protein [Nitrospirales bacterium]|nr:TolC family protein [Nitrospirales bacterium]